MKRTAVLLFVTLACGSKAPPPPPTPPPPAVIAARGATLAVYMPGGNLEDSVTVRGSWAPDEGKFLPAGQPSKWGAASDDLRELAEGLKSREISERVSVWVAFGGARKTGWHGIRYVDGACLVVDAADELFGNAPCAAFTDEKADLSQPETLSRFLEFVKGRQGPGPNALVLWGQGGAHEGVLYDTGHQEIPLMRLPQLRHALETAAAHFDVLGMDAGLMASLEAADVVRPFARWMVASPGRAPGHGWDYRAVLRAMATKDADGQTVARAAADAFMDGESLTLDAAGARQTVPHKQSRAKTISVIDSSKVELVSKRLDELVSADKRAWPRLTTAFFWAPPAARERKSETTESVDLAGAARVTKALVTNLAAKAELLAKAVGQAVPHSRHDPQFPWDTKLTVFSPATDRLWRLGYEEAGLLSPGWRAFLGHELGHTGNDRKAPVAKWRRGVYDVSDDRRLTQVFVLRAQPTGKDRWRALGATETTLLTALEEGRNQTGRIPAWDGKVLSLCNGDCARSITVPAQLEATLASGHVLVSAPALLRDPARKTDGEDVTLFVELAKDEVVDAWLSPIERDTESRVLFSREQYPLEKGHSIAFFALERDDPKEAPQWKAGPFLDLTEAPRWRRAPAGKSLTMLVAVDPGHNATYLPVN